MDNHPLAKIAVTASHFKCFGEHESGFNSILPINLIIGRNNSGKSTLLDLIELAVTSGGSYDPIKHEHQGEQFKVQIQTAIDQQALRRVFQEHVHTHGVPGRSDWEYGRQYSKSRITGIFSPGWNITRVQGPEFVELPDVLRTKFNKDLSSNFVDPFRGLVFRKVGAERDVKPEGLTNSTETRKIAPSGIGTTNLISSFYTDSTLPREEVSQGLLGDLNKIYIGDSEFTEITCRQDTANNSWEVFLSESNKGDIRLSQSGSGLKTVLIILALLRLSPIIENIDWNKTVLAVEEPENNLHPSLLRRLLDFLADEREQKGFSLFITTHSPIGIDWTSRRPDSQIIHVQHNGVAANTKAVKEYQDNKNILEDLDIRASDILQANGIIWVEGPTDRIYLNNWIKLITNGKLKEGTHYTIMFYGGKLLSHLEALPPDEERKLIPLLSINRNIAILMDSDRHLGSDGKKPRMHISVTKRRIRDEVSSNGGFAWITEGREVENYVPKYVWGRVAGKSPPKKDWTFEKVPQQRLMSAYKEDKVKLAHAAVASLRKEDIVGHLDLNKQLTDLCSLIKTWNKIED